MAAHAQKMVKPTLVEGRLEVTLGEYAELIRDFASPSNMGEALYIGLEHIGEGTLSLLGRGVATDVASTKAKFRCGDILFGKLRPYFRKVVRAPANGLCSTDIWVVRARNGVDQGFLYYCMASQQFIDFAAAGSEGTRMPRAKWDYASQYAISLPPFPEQRKIAHVLGTLDDKIELNRRMNETLEAMAQALFKSWFVDFEPVRAKMDGRWQRGESLPGLPVDLYDYFPDRLVDSELGDIPEGWEVRALGEVAEQRRSSVKPEQITPDTPYIALEHMPRQCIALSEWGIADDLASSKFRFGQGDILFGKLRPYFHKVGVAPLDGVCSTDIVVVSSKSPKWFGFVLGHLSSSAFVDYTDAASTGTKMPRTNWADMARYEIVHPSDEVANAFAGLVQPWVKSIVSAVHQSRALALHRDALLPELVSGKVRFVHGDIENVEREYRKDP